MALDLRSVKAARIMAVCGTDRCGRVLGPSKQGLAVCRTLLTGRRGEATSHRSDPHVRPGLPQYPSNSPRYLRFGGDSGHGAARTTKAIS